MKMCFLLFKMKTLLRTLKVSYNFSCHTQCYSLIMFRSFSTKSILYKAPLRRKKRPLNIFSLHTSLQFLLELYYNNKKKVSTFFQTVLRELPNKNFFSKLVLPALSLNFLTSLTKPVKTAADSAETFRSNTAEAENRFYRPAVPTAAL